MTYKDLDIEINEKAPFANCKLGRQKYAEILTQIVSVATDGCVLALNGEWGTGKTTFVKMWKQYLENKGFKTLYFNVWEKDFISDPIIALTAELRKVENSTKDMSEKFRDVIEKAGKVAKNAIPSFLKAISKRFLGEEVVEATQEVIEQAISIYTKEIEDYEEDCNSIVNFKQALSEWVETLNLGEERPLIFFVDELDRCNPHYAVKVLERIKHLFSVPKIVFVLSIDKKQLCNSICGYYGSDKINANEYLRRFIDVDYYLPEPELDKYFDFLYEQLAFDKLFSKLGGTYEEQRSKDYFVSIAKMLMEYQKPSLRQVKKMPNQIWLVLQTYSSTVKLPLRLLVFLVYLRQNEYEIYQHIKHRDYDKQELVNNLEKCFAQLIQQRGSYSGQPSSISYAIAELLTLYSCVERGSVTYELLDEKEEVLTFSTTIDKNTMIEAVKSAQKRYKAVFPLCDIIENVEVTSLLYINRSQIGLLST